MKREEIYQEFLESPAGSVTVREEDSDNPKLISGVPLGGIGTGKFEICPDGALHHITINNNDVFPIDGMLGTFVAVSARSADSKVLKILQTRSEIASRDMLLKSEEIRYRGLYPRCMVEYVSEDLPLKIKLTAFSPVIPRFLEASSLPIAFLIFDVENASSSKVDGNLVFSWEDVSGCWGSKVSWDSFVPPTEPHFSADRGLARKIEISPFARGVVFAQRDRHPEIADFSYGDYSLVVQSPFHAFVRQYDPAKEEDVATLFDDLLENDDIDSCLENKPGQYAAAVGTGFSLWQGEKARIVFALSWYTPDRWGFGTGEIVSRVSTPYDHAGRKMGHWYSNFYTSSWEILEQNLDLMEDYLEEIEGWQGYILDSSLPRWLKEMLVNQNYLLSSNMTLAKDGRFTILESPNCPCLGTIDQRFYGSPMTLIFCPELDHRELMMYAEFSDRLFEKLGKYKGQIYHDFGNNRIDFLNNYGYNWIDLNPKFVLLCWRNYLYTGNIDNLREIYYKAKEAMEREKSLDRDGDDLPEGYGNCNTFEGHFFGANSYDGGLWLAALKIFPRMARIIGEEQEARRYEAMYDSAKQSFDAKLWDEGRQHYIMCTESKDTRTAEELKDEDTRYLKKNENPNRLQCRDDQLTGSWYSRFLNEGPANDREKVITAIETMEEKLKVPVSQDGVLIRQSELVNSNWPGYNVGHFAALAIHMGFVDLGISAVKGIHDLIYSRYGMIWDQPIGLLVEGRPRGDRYMNSGTIWHVLWALQGFHVDVRGGVLGFRPSIPAEWKDGFVSPVVTGSFWGMARYRETDGDEFAVELDLEMDRDVEIRRLLLKSGGRDQIQEVEIDGVDPEDFNQRIEETGDLVLEFPEPLLLPESCPVRVAYRLR